MGFSDNMTVIYNINISHNAYDEVFVQTNGITNHKMIMMGYCEYLTMTEEDATELAKTLSFVCETIFEDMNHHCTIYVDGETINKYDNE